MRSLARDDGEFACYALPLIEKGDEDPVVRSAAISGLHRPAELLAGGAGGSGEARDRGRKISNDASFQGAGQSGGAEPTQGTGTLLEFLREVLPGDRKTLCREILRRLARPDRRRAGGDRARRRGPRRGGGRRLPAGSWRPAIWRPEALLPGRAAEQREPAAAAAVEGLSEFLAAGHRRHRSPGWWRRRSSTSSAPLAAGRRRAGRAAGRAAVPSQPPLPGSRQAHRGPFAGLPHAHPGRDRPPPAALPALLDSLAFLDERMSVVQVGPPPGGIARPARPPFRALPAGSARQRLSTKNFRWPRSIRTFRRPKPPPSSSR